MTTHADDLGDEHADEAYGSLPPSDGADFGDDVEPGRTTLLADMLDTYFTALEVGVPPTQWPVGEGWGTLAFRPHSVMVFGGPPNVGKTPLMMNLTWQAMQITPSLRVLIANNESMVPELVETLTAMLGGINLRDVQARDRSRCTPEKLAVAREALRSVADRIEFMEIPFSLEQVVERAEAFRADIVVIDTLQKLRLEGYDGEVGDKVGRIMPMLRELASRGPCVVAAAQISREGVKHLQGRVGSKTYDERDTSVFLHSSEIESSCNDAFLLVYEKGARVYQGPDDEYVPLPMWLQHVKARNTLKTNIPLLFDGRYQKFTLRSVEKAPEKQPARRSGVQQGGISTGTPLRLPQSPVRPKLRAPAAPSHTNGGSDDDHQWVT
jgi:hypothetical protein